MHRLLIHTQDKSNASPWSSPSTETSQKSMRLEEMPRSCFDAAVEEQYEGWDIVRISAGQMLYRSEEEPNTTASPGKWFSDFEGACVLSVPKR